MSYTLTESGEVLTETQEGRIGHDCAECAAVRAALDVAMTTLEQIATTPRNKGARRNAYSTLAFLRTQLKTPKLDVASCTGEQPEEWNF